MASSERFGYEWHKYDFLLPQYEEQFLKWVYPLTKDSFKDKILLDAGCGMGRNSYWPLKYGAKFVYAFDLDERSISAAKENLKDFNNVEIGYDDINTYNSPNEVDIAFSIGVIHHLHRPGRALANMVKSIKPGGKLLIWVYGREGNEWIVKYVDPIRKNITSRLPVGLVHFLTYIVSIPLYLFIKLLPQHRPYLKQLKSFEFRHVHSIVFDQLIPEVANYWTRQQAEDLLSAIPDLKKIKSYSVNGRSWTVIAEKS